MLSILNELTMQKELQVDRGEIMCFRQKSKTTTTSNITFLPEPGIEPGTSSSQVGCMTSG